jgi:hypothetical protein
VEVEENGIHRAARGIRQVIVRLVGNRHAVHDTDRAGPRRRQPGVLQPVTPTN